MRYYYNDREEEYRPVRRDERPLFRKEFELPPEEPRVQPKKVIRALLRDQEEEIEPLKRLSPEIIGTLFDRVNFLQTRIGEIRESVDIRQKLHKDMMAEIDEDIREKMQIESRLTDIDEKRNLKLDISMLRKEKRTENIRCWKDLMELKTELRELLEQLETESKITKIFNEVRG